jgi:hypothetical protein
MSQSTGRHRRLLQALAIFGFLYFPFSGLAQSPLASPLTVDLHAHGFPSGAKPSSTWNVKTGLFYLSGDRLAVFFDRQLSGSEPNSHSFQILTIDEKGLVHAKRVVQADPKATDFSAGPGGGILVGKAEGLDFYDADVQLLGSNPLPETATSVKFDRKLNQLVLSTVDQKQNNRTAHFIDGSTREQLASLSYPLKSSAIFGERQLAYTEPGMCQGALHVEPNPKNWKALDALQACDALTFVGNEALAYALSQDLFIVDSNGKQLFHGHIPAPDSFRLPSMVGLSDDDTRLAIMANMKRSFFSLHRGWQYYNEVFVYDLRAKRMIFKHALAEGAYAAALSPDGRQLATVEEGILKLFSIP